MAKTTMYVTKSAEPKEKANVALIHTEADVPAFLAGIVTVSDGKVFIGTCIEGKELSDAPCFIAWEPDQSCEGGYNVWCKSNGFTTLFQQDGKWFEKPNMVKYEQINWDQLQIPAFATEAPIEIGAGTITLHATWGDQSASAPEPYAVLGYADGSFALLKLNSDSAREYYICTEEGRILEPLVK